MSFETSTLNLYQDSAPISEKYLSSKLILFDFTESKPWLPLSILINFYDNDFCKIPERILITEKLIKQNYFVKKNKTYNVLVFEVVSKRVIIINYIKFHSHVIQKGCRNFLIRRKDFWAALLSVEQWNLVKFNEVKCQSISKKLHWYLLDAHQSNYLFINTQWQYIYIVLYSLKKFNQLVRSLVNILFTF